MARRFWVLIAFCAAATTASALGQQTGSGGAAVQKPLVAGAPRDVVGAPPQNPQSPTGTGTLAGTVVYADSGRPARRARVGLSAIEPRFGKSVTADDQGRFSFTDLPAGQFTLTASKPGFLDSQYGQKRLGSTQPGTPIRLIDGQKIQNVTMGLARGGVITGTVLDDQGEPSFGTNVRVMRYVMRTGERVLQSAGSGTTDDRGIYRIPSLSPGDYVVIATPRDTNQAAIEELMMRAEQVAAAARQSGATDQAMVDVKMAVAAAQSGSGIEDQPSGYAPVYYPGTTLGSGATTVALGLSEERAGIDVQLQLVPMARIAGQLMIAEGQMMPGTVQLVDLQALPGATPRSVRTGVDGRFSFPNVAPGQYTLMARMAVPAAPQDRVSLPPSPVTQERVVVQGDMQMIVSSKPSFAGEMQTLWANEDIVADGRSVSNVVMTLRPGVALAGGLTFEGTAPVPPDLTRLRVSLSQVGGAGATMDMSVAGPAVADKNGRFTFKGVVPGRYRITVGGAPGNWKLKSAMINGHDAMDFPLEIKSGEDIAGAVLTMTDRSTELSGSIQDPTGAPRTDLTIIVFATDSRFWTPMSRRIQATRPSTDGRFQFRDLPAGDYRIIAVTEAEQGQWFDPNFLRQLVGGSMAISLAEGERKQQDIRVAR